MNRRTAGSVPGNAPPTPKAPWTFVGLVFVLALPFWVFGPVVQRSLGNAIPINLPVSALQFVCPLIAASILTHREHGSAGVKGLLKRAFDVGRIKDKIWYGVIFGLMPLAMAAEYGVQRFMGVEVPAPQFPVWLVAVFFAAFFLPALCEEIGWSGYALDPLQARWTALGAGLILGVVWAAWHVVPNTQAPHTAAWLLGQFGNTVALRVLIVWLYNSTGKSVFAAIAFHDMVNVSEFLFPVYGSYYDPVILFVILAAICAIVAFLWGPETLSRYRFARVREPLRGPNGGR